MDEELPGAADDDGIVGRGKLEVVILRRVSISISIGEVPKTVLRSEV